MKLSFYGRINEAIKQRGHSGFAAYVRELGCGGVEGFPGPGLETIADAKALKAAMDSEGLSATCFSVYAMLVGEDAAKNEDRLKYLVEMAHEIGSPYLHHTLVPGEDDIRPGHPRFQSIFDEVAQRAGRVADYAAQAGMMTLYEDQGMIFNDPDVLDMLLKALNRKNVGICADFGNILMVEGTPEEFIRRNIGRIYNVHVKDFLRKSPTDLDPGNGWYRTRSGGYLRDTVLGHGVVDVVECLKLLLDSGYDGWYAFEFWGPEPLDWGMKRSVENFERYYKMAVQA